MLHILLLILKIIGIIILSILGLILLLIGILLFVPVRYRMDGNYDGNFVLKGRLHFLLHIVNMHIDYDSAANLKEVPYRIRILGFTVKSNKKKPPKAGKKTEARQPAGKQQAAQPLAEKKTEAQESVRRRTQAQIPAGRQQAAQTSMEKQPAEQAPSGKQIKAQEPAGQETTAQAPTGEKTTAQPPGGNQSGKRTADTARRRDNGFKSKAAGLCRRIRALWKKVTGFLRGIWEKIANIPYTIKKMCDRINQLQETIAYYRALWEAEETKRAVVLCRKQLRYLYKKLKPGLFQCRLRVGMEDPYYTGQILSYYSMLYPWIGNNVFVTPDFENAVFKGDFVLRGRIRLFTLIKVAVILYFNKNIRNLLDKLKREDSENGGE